MSLADVETRGDLELFNEIVSDWDDFLPCNFANGACDEKAAYTIQCPACGALEPSCAMHDAIMLTWDPETIIDFECSHRALLKDCPRNPL